MYMNSIFTTFIHHPKNKNDKSSKNKYEPVNITYFVSVNENRFHKKVEPRSLFDSGG